MEAGAAPARRRPFGRRRSVATAALFLLTLLIAGVVVWFAFAGGEEEILVVVPRERADQVADLRGEVVVVIGTLRAAGAEDVPGVGADDVEGEATIVASSVRPAGEGAEGLEVEEIADGDNGLSGSGVVAVGRLDERLGVRTFSLEAID